MLRQSTQTEHIIIIDDSSYIRTALARAIFSSCAMINKDVYMINSHDLQNGKNGGMLTTTLAAPGLVIGLADNAKHALEMLDPILVRRATILCDIETPDDMQVGIYGLLDHLAATGIAVNLIFISINSQNINWVKHLTDRRKAYFVPKDSPAWARLPYALVQNMVQFEYCQIERLDYDVPFLNTAPLPELVTLPPPARPVPAPPTTWFDRVGMWFQGFRHRLG